MKLRETSFIGGDAIELNKTKGPACPTKSNQPELDSLVDTVDALYANEEFFPGGILSAFGYDEGVQRDRELSDDVDFASCSQTEIVQTETYLRYSWIVLFYCALPLVDLISDFVVTGIGLGGENVSLAKRALSCAMFINIVVTPMISGKCSYKNWA